MQSTRSLCKPASYFPFSTKCDQLTDSQLSPLVTSVPCHCDVREHVCNLNVISDDFK